MNIFDRNQDIIDKAIFASDRMGTPNIEYATNGAAPQQVAVDAVLNVETTEDEYSGFGADGGRAKPRTGSVTISKNAKLPAERDIAVDFIEIDGDPWDIKAIQSEDEVSITLRVVRVEKKQEHARSDVFDEVT